MTFLFHTLQDTTSLSEQEKLVHGPLEYRSPFIAGDKDISSPVFIIYSNRNNYSKQIQPRLQKNWNWIKSKAHILLVWYKSVKGAPFISCNFTYMSRTLHQTRPRVYTVPYRLSSSYIETKMSSFSWNFNHWLHWKFSFWQLPVQPVMKISSKWRHFRFSVPVVPMETCRK